MDSYIAWLKDRNKTLFEAAGTYWRLYHDALVPASLKPEPIELQAEEESELLRRSGALLLRYFTRTSEEPTAFWYTACQEYKIEDLHRKTRTQIRRAYKDCRIERVDPGWLSDNGYACYVSAYSRYRNAQPESKAGFDAMCRGSAGGPFDFWAVFVGNNLAGFGKYVVGEDYAAGIVLKLDPRFLSLSPASAFQDTILTAYVGDQRKTVIAGFRSVAHETNMHEFLLKFGYSRVYCDLKLAYRPSLRTFVNALYPFRSIVEHAPQMGITSKVKVLLAQEEIRRSFEINRGPVAASLTQG